MKNSLLAYSNGWGHLIMSVITTCVGLALVLFSKDSTIQGTGVTLILTVNGAWFISGSAKQVATEVASLLKQPANTDTSSGDKP